MSFHQRERERNGGRKKKHPWWSVVMALCLLHYFIFLGFWAHMYMSLMSFHARDLNMVGHMWPNSATVLQGCAPYPRFLRGREEGAPSTGSHAVNSPCDLPNHGHAHGWPGTEAQPSISLALSQSIVLLTIGPTTARSHYCLCCSDWPYLASVSLSSSWLSSFWLSPNWSLRSSLLFNKAE